MKRFLTTILLICTCFCFAAEPAVNQEVKKPKIHFKEVGRKHMLNTKGQKKLINEVKKSAKVIMAKDPYVQFVADDNYLVSSSSDAINWRPIAVLNSNGLFTAFYNTNIPAYYYKLEPVTP